MAAPAMAPSGIVRFFLIARDHSNDWRSAQLACPLSPDRAAYRPIAPRSVEAANLIPAIRDKTGHCLIFELYP